MRSIYCERRDGCPQPIRVMVVGIGAEERLDGEGGRDCLSDWMYAWQAWHAC